MNYSKIEYLLYNTSIKYFTHTYTEIYHLIVSLQHSNMYKINW